MFGSRHSCLEFRCRVGVRTLALHVLSLCVSARSRVRSAVRYSVHVCFVVLHAVSCFLSAACVHVISSCAVWHAACVFHWLHASCCHVLCEHVTSVLVFCVPYVLSCQFVLTPPILLPVY